MTESRVLETNAKAQKERSLLVYGGIFALATVGLVGAVQRQFPRELMIMCPPVMFVGGLGAIFTAIRTNEAWKALTKAPERVAWIYSLHLQPSGQVCIALGLTDGSVVTLGLDDAADQAAAMAEARARAPHAVAGYSPELDEEFRRNPGGFVAKYSGAAAAPEAVGQNAQRTAGIRSR